jgi:hypothetical protein
MPLMIIVWLDTNTGQYSIQLTPKTLSIPFFHRDRMMVEVNWLQDKTYLCVYLN